MHIGLEVEGRLKGIPSLFVNRDEFLSGAYKRVTHPYHNLYITDHDNLLDLESINNTRNPLCDPIITIERTAVDRQYPNLNIIFVVQVPMYALKDTDQIKTSIGQNVWMATVESMIKTTEDAFVGDINV